MTGLMAALSPFSIVGRSVMTPAAAAFHVAPTPAPTMPFIKDSTLSRAIFLICTVCVCVRVRWVPRCHPILSAISFTYCLSYPISSSHLSSMPRARDRNCQEKNSASPHLILIARVTALLSSPPLHSSPTISASSNLLSTPLARVKVQKKIQSKIARFESLRRNIRRFYCEFDIDSHPLELLLLFFSFSLPWASPVPCHRPAARRRCRP